MQAGRSKFDFPDKGRGGLVPPLPGPLLYLSMEERGMLALCFGESGPWLSRCLDEKGQGIAATMPNHTAFFCGVAGGGLVREVWTGC